jgi:hypothetical protein
MNTRMHVTIAAATLALLISGCDDGGDTAPVDDTTIEEQEPAATGQEETIEEQEPSPAGEEFEPGSSEDEAGATEGDGSLEDEEVFESEFEPSEDS